MKMFVIVCAICLVVFSVWLGVWSKYPMPPVFPGALPIIGHMHYISSLDKIWPSLAQVSEFTLENGGISIFKISEHKLYVLTDPDLSHMAYNVCLNKMYVYHFSDDLVRNGLVTADAQTWKIHRKLINPAFNQQVLNTFMDDMNTQAKRLVSDISTLLGKSVNMRKLLIKFTMSIVSRTALGLSPEDQTLIDIDYAHAFEKLSMIYAERGVKVWLHLPFFFNRSALKRKQDKLTETVKNILIPIIQKRRLEMKMNGYNMNENNDKFKPLLNHLLYLADEQNAFTDDEIQSHLNTFVIASYDTSTVTFTLLLMVIGWYKDAQERIYNEIQEVLGNEDRDFTKNDLPKLVYLEAVIKETLRMYPTIPFIGRQVNKDVNLGKYTIPSGSTCLISLYGIHHHPMWGPDANQFKPERWLDPARLPNNPNAFVAFGVGKRNCIGRQYSMMVMKTAIGHIVRQYNVHSDLSKLKFQFEVVLQPIKGHRITFTKRT